MNVPDSVYAEISDVSTANEVGTIKNICYEATRMAKKENTMENLKKCVIILCIAVVVLALGVVVAIALSLGQTASTQQTVTTMTERLDTLTQQMNVSGTLFQQLAQNQSALSAMVEALEMMIRTTDPTPVETSPPTTATTAPTPAPASTGTPGQAVYTRWGKSSCPEMNGTSLLYSGLAAGSAFSIQGGGANHLCLPGDPEYSPDLTYKAGIDGDTTISGSEYENPAQGTDDHNIPCAVCLLSTRPTVVMIPGKATCPPAWTREYYGYLMAERDRVPHQRSTFECVDQEQESLPESSSNRDAALFYHVEVDCVNLPCPPYNRDQEVNCVVCSK